MYGDILDNAALPTLWQYFGEGPFLFQQDNCSVHTSRLAQTWFDEMGVQELDWPYQSADYVASQIGHPHFKHSLQL
ncbi:transposable element Tcb1 transposase [Trichonephila clavipes]|nr:transposable element Tcb1 transposase [Trichonephila clavipes]